MSWVFGRFARPGGSFVTATTAVAIALVAGCTTGADTGARSSGEPSTTTTHDPPGPQAGPTIPADDPIAVELLGRDAVSGEWTLAVDPTAADATISVWATLYCGHDLDRVLVHETPKTITLAATHRPLDDPTGDSVCPALQAHQPVDVELLEPIGDRQLRHVAVSSDLN